MKIVKNYDKCFKPFSIEIKIETEQEKEQLLKACNVLSGYVMSLGELGKNIANKINE